ncbi:MAG: hypothetical protein AAF483_10040 [Planctomycetota bacterium]
MQLLSPKAGTLALSLAFAFCWQSTWLLAQKSEEDQTLRAMYRSGLNASAITYCERQAELSVAQPRLLARWTMRLMESHAQNALRVDKQLEQQAWARGDEVFEKFSKDHFKNPRIPWLAWQQGRNRLLRAQANVARHLAAPADQKSKEDALQFVRDILRLMEKLDDDIKRRQPIAARQVLPNNRTEAPAEDLMQLRVDAGLLRCEALLLRSQLYPKDSVDRQAAATDAEEQATSILQLTGKEWEPRPALEIARAKANLELGKVNAALQVLAKLSRGSVSDASGSSFVAPETAARAAAVAIEYLAQEGRVSQARGLLGRLAGPELELAKLRIGLAELEQATGEADRDARLKGLLASTQAIGKDFGPYWQNRAEALLLSGGAKTNSGASANLDLMIVEVKQLLAAEKKSEAIEKLLEFRDSKAASGDGAAAIELASLASALLQQDKQWPEAAQAIAKTVVQFKSQASAAKAHRQVISCYRNALKVDETNTSLAQSYEDSLKNQLRHWPDSEQTAAPQQWLTMWLTGKSRSAELAELLMQRAISCDDEGIARSTFQDWLALTLSFEKEQRSSAFDSLQSTIDEKEMEHTNLATNFWIVGQTFAKWPEPSQAEELDSQLSRQLGGLNSPAASNLLAAAILLRSIQRQDLDAVRRDSSKWNPETIPRELLAEFLTRFVEAIDYTENTQPSSWTEELHLNTALANFFLASKNRSERVAGLRLAIWLGISGALEELRELAKSNPRDGKLQLQLAFALREADLQASSKIARRLSVGAASGSPLHLGAHLLYIRNLAEEKGLARAKQETSRFLARQPIGSELWKSRFEHIANAR